MIVNKMPIGDKFHIFELLHFYSHWDSDRAKYGLEERAALELKYEGAQLSGKTLLFEEVFDQRTAFFLLFEKVARKKNTEWRTANNMNDNIVKIGGVNRTPVCLL